MAILSLSKIHLLQNGTNVIRFSNRSCKIRWFSGGTESAPPDFPLENAYDILGVSEKSSFAEIKDSFRKLAKETHPDLSESKTDSASCQRFVEILAAYEILSDPERRRDYDQYLFSRRNIVHTNSRQGRRLYTFQSYGTVDHDMEVVEWLKWYRSAIHEIVYERKVAAGTGYFDELEQDFYSAIHAAYFGPEIETMDLLPDRFEAEERSTYETPEVLHLVSGRDLFGMVCLANNIPQLSTTYCQKLGSSVSWGLDSCQSAENISIYSNSHEAYDTNSLHQLPENTAHKKKSDAYRDLELHAFGKLVATATRVPAKSCFHGVHDEDEDKQQDHICVYLSSDYLVDPYKGSCGNGVINGALGSRIPLGTITGLGTCPDEGTCSVYDSSGTKTHMIMKHRTLLVKHMHWFEVGDKVSICECRCTRAKLPPSKFWLFEPRCGMHDIGGWYIETFGRDKKGRTVEAQRYWDGSDSSEQFDRRLHPAMYLLGLAYRTLDIEEANRMRKSLRNTVDRHFFKFLSWCKKIV